MDGTDKDINNNEVTTTTIPQPPPPPPPTVQITKDKPIEFFNVTIPDQLKGSESYEKDINDIKFLPELPVVYVPFNFIFKTINKGQKSKNYQKSIVSSSWVILNSDGDENSPTSIDKQLQYTDTTISYTPKKEDANKILKIQIKLSPSLFTSDHDQQHSTTEKKPSIFSKLFGHKDNNHHSTTSSSSNNNTNNEPIIIEYKHKILFEKKRELLQINESKSNNSTYRVIQYNILADCYVSDSYYTNIPSYALRWNNYRSLLMVPQILQYNADIIGLQEVDRMYWQLFKELNVQGGYSYYPNYADQDKPQTNLNGFNNEYREGCFIFYKKEKFNFLKGLELNYTKLMNGDSKLLSKELIEKYIQDPIYKNIITHFLQHSSHHVHHCLVLIQDKVTKERMIVVSKHLYWGSEGYNYHIQCVQIHLFTEILKQFIKSNQLEEDTPIIVCGDFNSSPGSTCYNYLVNGVMANDDHHLTLAGKYQPAFNSDAFKDDTTGIKSIKHDFGFKSVYSFRPDGETRIFTIVSKSFSGNIDQIYITTNRLKVNNILELGEKSDYNKLPSLTLASDHILLMTDLELLPSTSTSTH